MLIGIDPGHGGSNTGCQNNGIVEKNYTLEAARKLRYLLEGHGILGELSRGGDETTSFAERAEALMDCRMVVSLHVNASPSATACDLRTYALEGDRIAVLAGNEMERCAPRVLMPRQPSCVIAKPDTAEQNCYNVMIPHKRTTQLRPVLLVEMFFSTHEATARWAQTRWGSASIVHAMAAGILVAVEEMQARG
jgi:N-acetylmuramoyl-L-alanine amidase